MVTITQSHVCKVGSQFFDIPSNRSNNTIEQIYAAFFGLTPAYIALLWNKIDRKVFPLNDVKHIKYLMLLLMFLRTYATNIVLANQIGVDVTTLARWIWHFVYKISMIPMVSRSLTSLYNYHNIPNIISFSLSLFCSYRLNGKIDY